MSKKSSKASIFISGLVNKSSLDIQVFLMNTNIIIPVLYFFGFFPSSKKKQDV